MKELSNNTAYLKHAIMGFAESSKGYSQSQYQMKIAAIIAILATRNHLLENTEIHDAHEIIQVIERFLSDNRYLGNYADFIRPIFHENHRSLMELVWRIQGISVSNEDLLFEFNWVLSSADINIASTITPDEVAILMLELVKVSPNSSILDPAMGTGGFLRAAKQLVTPSVHCSGIEINQQVGFVNALYCYIENLSLDESMIGDAFCFLPDNNQRFDFVLSNPPITRIAAREAYRKYDHSFHGRLPSGEMSLNFIQLGLSKLKSSGSAAFLVNMSILFSQGDAKHVRKEWLERGVIRAVIVLPAKLLSHTTNKCAILLFENEESKEKIVKFVKADDLYERESPRRNLLPKVAYAEISKRLNNPERTIDSAWINFDEIKSTEYSLHPDAYVKKEIDEIAHNVAKQWVKLGEIAEIIQGTRVLAKLPGGNSLVIKGKNISELRDGTASLKPVNLETAREKVHVTKPYDVLLKRLGDRSCAYMVTPDDAVRVVDQTVFILRFKILKPKNIYFICEFLNSNRGSSHISSFCRSTTVQTLTKTILNEIDVPMSDEPLQELLLEMGHAEKELKSEFKKAVELRQQIFDGLGYEQADGDFDSVRFALKTLEAALSQKDKVSYKVSISYPFPLAYAYRNIYMEREYSAIYDQQMKFGEMLLSFLASIGLSLLTHHSDINNNLLIKISDDFKSALVGGISPGHWQSLLHDISTRLRELKECPMATEFSNVWFKGRGNKLSEFAHASTTELVQKLNDKKHHRGPSNAKACKAFSEKHKIVLDNLLLNIEFISQWEFFINDEISYRPQENEFVSSISILRGDHPCFEQAELMLSKPLVDNEIYFKYHGSIIPMTPFLCACSNGQTNRIEIYSLDKKDKRGCYMQKSFDSGHSKQADKEYKDKIDAWFEKYAVRNNRGQTPIIPFA